MSAADDEMPQLKPPPSWAVALAFAIIFMSWGTTYLATSIAMKEEHMPPALFGGARISLAGIILLTFQRCRGHSLWLRPGDYLRLLSISWCLFLAANFLINVGQQQVPSGVSAILIATTPLWIGLFGMAWPSGDRLSWLGWLGLLLGFAGVLLTEYDKGFRLFDDHYPLFILASAAAWAVGSLLSRHMVLKIPHFTSAGWQMLLGGGSQVILGTLLGEWHEFPEPIRPRAVGMFFYLLVVGSLMGFVTFNWLLGHVSVAKVGTYAYVNPIIAVFVGWCAGETIVDAMLLAGIAVILVGVYLVRSDHAPSKEIELEPD
jgi:drug/metabolite transporter (DMT)-like permease